MFCRVIVLRSQRRHSPALRSRGAGQREELTPFPSSSLFVCVLELRTRRQRGHFAPSVPQFPVGTHPPCVAEEHSPALCGRGDGESEDAVRVAVTVAVVYEPAAVTRRPDEDGALAIPTL